MRAPIFQLAATRPACASAPALMAVGLVALLAQAWLPAMPVVTALTFVSLGATLATIERFQSAASLRAILAAHLFTYGSLYFVFVGAICHAAMTGPQNGVTFFQGLDFGLSVLPMTLTVRLSLTSITSFHQI